MPCNPVTLCRVLRRRGNLNVGARPYSTPADQYVSVITNREHFSLYLYYLPICRLQIWIYYRYYISESR